MDNVESNVFTGGADNTKSIVLESKANSITLKPVGNSINIYTNTDNKLTSNSALSGLAVGSVSFSILNCNEKHLCLTSDNGFIYGNDAWFKLTSGSVAAIGDKAFSAASCANDKIGMISDSNKLCLGVTAGETYVLTTSAPANWETNTNCHAYYKKVGSAYVVEDGECNTVTWAENTYYEKKAAGQVLEIETTVSGVKDYIMLNVDSNVFEGTDNDDKYIVVRAHPDGFTWNNNLPAGMVTFFYLYILF